MHLHLNPIGGLAGDMFCAALLDLAPDLLPTLQQQLDRLAMPVPVRLELQSAPGPLSGKRFLVKPATEAALPQPHHTYRDIRRLLSESQLEPDSRQRALTIFRLLAEAEAQVHEIDLEQVHFHEVGNWDAIADIVCAAVLQTQLNIQSCSCEPLPLGGGRVQTAHGILPVPAPATRLLMQGLAVVDDAIGGERVTPTGAAILKALQPRQRRQAGTLQASGMGFGSRQLEGLPNCLQALCLGQPEGAQYDQDRVCCIGFEIDDQNPEDFAQAMDRLRAIQGVLSVTSLQAIGKRGRPTMVVQVLLRPEVRDTLVQACFAETSTIGLRVQEVDRLLLSREQLLIQLEDREYRLKRVLRPDGPSIKMEAGDLDKIAGFGTRERLRRRALKGLEDEQDV